MIKSAARNPQVSVARPGESVGRVATDMLDPQSFEDLAPLLQRRGRLRGIVRAQGWAEAEKAKAQRNPAAMREHEQIFGQAPSRFGSGARQGPWRGNHRVRRRHPDKARDLSEALRAKRAQGIHRRHVRATSPSRRPGYFLRLQRRRWCVGVSGETVPPPGCNTSKASLGGPIRGESRPA